MLLAARCRQTSRPQRWRCVGSQPPRCDPCLPENRNTSCEYVHTGERQWCQVVYLSFLIFTTELTKNQNQANVDSRHAHLHPPRPPKHAVNKSPKSGIPKSKTKTNQINQNPHQQTGLNYRPQQLRDIRVSAYSEKETSALWCVSTQQFCATLTTVGWAEGLRNNIP